MNDDSPDIATRSTRAHLGAAALAVVLFLLAAAGGSYWSRGLIATNFDALRRVLAEADADGPIEGDKVGKLDRSKNGGTALQREAFLRSDLLPLYGSSELAKPVPDKAELFFHDYPSGFAVFPVGRAGTDSLLFLQEIAAAGDATAGKRVALSLSPSWFCTQSPAEDAYLGNFSRFQAMGALLNRRLGVACRRELARRLASHPDSLKADPVLRFLTGRMAGHGPLDRAGYLAAWPLAHLEQAIEAEQDHFELVLYTKRYLHLAGTPPRPARAPLDWDRLIAEVGVEPRASSRSEAAPAGPTPLENDESFRESVENGPESRDLDLLLHGLHQLGMKPLVLCVPPQEHYYVRRGISKASLELFHAKVRSLAGRWGAEVETFADHTNDPQFLDIGRDHLSNRGWMYYNRALDEFYHAEPGQLTSGHTRGHRKDPAVGWFRGNT